MGLIFSSSAGELKIVQYLVENGINVNKKSFNKTALESACQSRKNIHIVKYLIKRGGANIIVENQRDYNQEGNALHFSSFLGNPEITKILLNESINLSNLFVTKDFLLKSKDYKGNTPLHDASSQDSLLTEAFTRMTNRELGCEDEVNNSDHLETIKILIKNGANVNLKNNQGETPLDLAKSKEIKEYLIKHGAKNL
jgi:ankyrin repeat protein